MELDERWAQVIASIGEPDYDLVEMWPPPGQFLEYRMEVRYNGMTYWQTQTFNAELKLLDYWDELEKATLNEMVVQIDERIAEGGVTDGDTN